MSGKTGRRPTGRKPSSVRRQSAKSDGAFGKETGEQVITGAASRNTDRTARNSRKGRAGSGV